MAWDKKTMAKQMTPKIKTEMGKIRQTLHSGSVSPREAQRLSELLGFGQECLDEYKRDLS